MAGKEKGAGSEPPEYFQNHAFSFALDFNHLHGKNWKVEKGRILKYPPPLPSLHRQKRSKTQWTSPLFADVINVWPLREFWFAYGIWTLHYFFIWLHCPKKPIVVGFQLLFEKENRFHCSSVTLEWFPSFRHTYVIQGQSLFLQAHYQQTQIVTARASHSPI